MNLLPPNHSDGAADAFVATFAPQCRPVIRSRLERCARALLALAPGRRPTRIGGKSLHVDLSRVPWASVSVEDCARVRLQLLDGQRSRASAGTDLGALRGVLRASGALTLAHLEALKVDAQLVSGRSVAATVRDWRADEAAELAEWAWEHPPAMQDPRRGPTGQWLKKPPKPPRPAHYSLSSAAVPTPDDVDFVPGLDCRVVRVERRPAERYFR